MSVCNFAPTSSSFLRLVFVSAKYFVVHVCVRSVLGHLPQSSHILLCFAAGAEWVYVRGSMVLKGGGVVVVVVCVGRRGGLIPGFALSLELGPWLSLPEVAAGGWQCAVIPNSVLVYL